MHSKKVPEIHVTLKKERGKYIVDHSTIQRWHTKFQQGQISIKENPGLGLMSTIITVNTNAAIIAVLHQED